MAAPSWHQKRPPTLAPAWLSKTALPKPNKRSPTLALAWNCPGPSRQGGRQSCRKASKQEGRQSCRQQAGQYGSAGVRNDLPPLKRQRELVPNPCQESGPARARYEFPSVRVLKRSSMKANPNPKPYLAWVRVCLLIRPLRTRTEPVPAWLRVCNKNRGFSPEKTFT